MKAKSLLLCLFSSSEIYAQNISVSSEGVTYECSEASSGTPVVIEPCGS